jgi:uncharacterized repeat protein (TIGR03803 family)
MRVRTWLDSGAFWLVGRGRTEPHGTIAARHSDHGKSSTQAGRGPGAKSRSQPRNGHLLGSLFLFLLAAAPPPSHAEGAKAVASITESPHQAALAGGSPDIPAHNGNPTFQILYNFCSQQPNCVDGTNPMTGLVIDGQGNLYGATGTNGAGMAGTVFQITPAPTGWVEKVIYEVAAGTGPILSTGGPSMTMDASGNIYGVTVDGVFQLAPNPGNTTWTFTKIYTFCPQLGCNDGDQPNGELLIDGAGNLYGTTYQGGRYGRGTVFQLTPDPSGNTWTEKVLYSFCPIWPCTDGWNPESGLVIDSGGNL